MAAYAALDACAVAMAADGSAAEVPAPADPWRPPRRCVAVALCCAALAAASWRGGVPGLAQRGAGGEDRALAAGAISLLDVAVKGIVEGRPDLEAPSGIAARRKAVVTQAVKNITEAVESITAQHDWKRFPGRVCSIYHGSGRFPDGSDGDGSSTVVDLDECLTACMENDFCSAVVVDAGALRSTCRLRSELILSGCSTGADAHGNLHDTWVKGPMFGRVLQIKHLSGWSRYEGKNCHPGEGSRSFPSQGQAPCCAHDTMLLDECLLRCEANAFCEAVVVNHGVSRSTCGLRFWTTGGAADCSSDSGFDTWKMDQGRSLPPGIEPVSGPLPRDRLHAVVEMVRGSSWESLDLTRCALVGASGAMLGSRRGAEIDGHTAVIRVNRVPVGGLVPDFGERTDIYYANFAGDGMVSLMSGGESPIRRPCGTRAWCPPAGIIARGDLVQCDPESMAKRWGSGHSLVGCTHRNISRMVATGFSSLEGKLATTGLQAFFTFLPVCGELNLYGFGGVSTADGHAEWTDGHNLYQEHLIQDHIIAGRWANIPWRGKFREFDWIKKHIARTRKVVGTVA